MHTHTYTYICVCVHVRVCVHVYIANLFKSSNISLLYTFYPTAANLLLSCRAFCMFPLYRLQEKRPHVDNILAFISSRSR